MKEFVSYNWFVRPEPEPPRSGERINPTEQGFLSLRVQVRRMKEAGEALTEYKKAMYDVFEERFDDVIGRQ